MARRTGICARCIVTLEETPSSWVQTMCCSKRLCVACFDACETCPVCRARLDRDFSHRQVPPPYIPQILSNTNNDEPPTYDEAAEGGRLNGVGSQPADGDFTSAVPYSLSLDTAEIVADDEGVSVIHYISNRDTLVGISLKYNVGVDVIKRTNKMFSNNIHEHEKLIIPGVKNLPKSVTDPTDEMKDERHRQRMTKRFQLVTKCIDPAEAQFYMEDCEFNLELGVKRYLEDLKWEQDHPQPNNKHQSYRQRQQQQQRQQQPQQQQQQQPTQPVRTSNDMWPRFSMSLFTSPVQSMGVEMTQIGKPSQMIQL